MIGDLVVFAVVVVALGGGGIAAGILVGRRLERRLIATDGPDGDGETIDGGQASPSDATGGPGRDAPLVEETR